MVLINLIFELGVLFAIYSFIWFFIDTGLAILMLGKKRSDEEIYIIRAIKYLFLVNITFQFSITNQQHGNFLSIIPSAIVLLVYFIGKFQKKQKQQAMSLQFGGLQLLRFNQKYELIIIILSVLLMIVLSIFPELGHNNIAYWFDANMQELSDTILIGIIFKIVGFFFLLNMIMKMINTLNYMLSGNPLIDIRTFFQRSKTKKDDEFDYFEEL